MSKAELVIGFEPISSALASGLADLVVFDWEEVSVGCDYPPLDIDWDAYLAQERRGEYRGISARKGGKLVGYNGYDVFRPKRHKSTLMAFGDAMYLDPDHRAGLAALRLLKKSHDLLKTIGVRYVVKGDMKAENLDTAKPRASFGDLLVKGAAYKPFDRSFILKL